MKLRGDYRNSSKKNIQAKQKESIANAKRLFGEDYIVLKNYEKFLQQRNNYVDFFVFAAYLCYDKDIFQRRDWYGFLR